MYSGRREHTFKWILLPPSRGYIYQIQQHNPLKNQYTADRLHGMTSQTTATFMAVTTMGISNLSHYSSGSFIHTYILK
jgi:hypothetical protein